MLSVCVEKLETIIFKWTYSVFTGAGVWHLFLIPHSYIHEVPMKLPQEIILDPRKYPQEKIWTQEMPTKKRFRPTKYPREKILDPRNTHEARWHDGTRPTRPTMAWVPQNLAHSSTIYLMSKYLYNFDCLQKKTSFQ